MSSKDTKIENQPITLVKVVKGEVVGYNGRKRVVSITTPDVTEDSKQRILDLRDELVEHLEDKIEQGKENPEQEFLSEEFLQDGVWWWKEIEAEGEDENGEEADEEHEGMHIKPLYRQRYQELTKSNWMSCADQLATELTNYCATTEKRKNKKGSTKEVDVCSVAKVKAVARQNGLTKRYDENWSELNPGHQRMCLGNTLRGMLRNGAEIKIGDKVVKPTKEMKDAIKVKDQAIKEKAKIKEDVQKAKDKNNAMAEKEKAKAKAEKEKAKAKAKKEKTKASKN